MITLLKNSNETIIDQNSGIIEVLVFDLTLHIIPDKEHDWLISTEEVAAAFGVSTKTINSHKNNHSDKFIEGKSFLHINLNHRDLTDTIRKIPLAGRPTVCYTKYGVITLSEFIKTPRAKEFYKWASFFTIYEKIKEKIMPVKLTKAKLCRWYLKKVEQNKLLKKDNLLLEKNNILLEEIIEHNKPLVENYNKLIKSKGLFSIEEVAKILASKFNIGTIRLFQFLRDVKVFFKSNEKHETNLPYQRFIERGYFLIKISTYKHPHTDEDIAYRRTFCTSKGVAFITQLLDEHGYERRQQ